ncbi:transcriptional regulator GcvA [Klebsiella variicola]|uniref:transcriptional regulator GcvA n=2 Tax=Klebsiella pneumoniae complex TaxID=3390273 RepID=UPI0009C80511|nr:MULTISPECIES: transcriptional regulator GcvA [Klebsiella]EMD1678898.1 transcriptional regulator GcvA [Klebsiella variicola]MDE4642737.1 transcriptional regulator GcvA [Klebsiella variicola]MDR6247069.1 LysR family glycine cleavage system transcriptional activator [Klebsiella variicola]MDR6252342.1 LysR family glycine cleavage system transcriptional activator [Klebsiella variicola]MDR6257843.1 LysR family glycine cleavage system transcriptional activator [Klebsiella sp. SORGH_AS_0826]
MIFDRLPPLQTLRAFEATARLSSMTLAAAELHVTHGAISRQIRKLEEHLGLKLFFRLTRQIILTQEGAQYHRTVTRLLSELTIESERLRGRNPAKSIRVSTTVSFASKWLAPRLSRFRQRYPGFDIQLDVTDSNVDLNDGQVDAAIRYGLGHYRDASYERIFDETVTSVCSPGFLKEHNGLTEIKELSNCILLHEYRMLANWEAWFEMAGEKNFCCHHGPLWTLGSMATEAAIRGEGVALGRSVLIADDVAAGRLVVPFPQYKLKAERGYDLVYRSDNQDSLKIRMLRQWLSEEMRVLKG